MSRLLAFILTISVLPALVGQETAAPDEKPGDKNVEALQKQRGDLKKQEERLGEQLKAIREQLKEAQRQQCVAAEARSA
jgi:hypothetical protein